MGQKVNPVGLRVGINRTWTSRWYARADYAKNLSEDLRIRKFITNFLEKGVEKKGDTTSVSRIEIERAARNLKINIHSGRPGTIIGKGGEKAEKMKAAMIKECKITGETTLNVFEVKKPDLDAQLLADGVKQQLERRVSFRRAMRKIMGSAMKAGAKGIKVQVAGRLAGADIARTERYMEGRVPLHTLRAEIDYSTSEAYTTYGLIGIKVWVFKGEILGDWHDHALAQQAAAGQTGGSNERNDRNDRPSR